MTAARSGRRYVKAAACGVKKLGSGLQPGICSVDAAGPRSWSRAFRGIRRVVVPEMACDRRWLGRRACSLGCDSSAGLLLGPSRGCDRCDGWRRGARVGGRMRGPRRADRPWQRVRRRPRLGGSGRRTLVVSFQQRGRAIVGRPARRGSDAVKAVRERRAQAATDQAVRLGAQELRPAGADPPRRRPQARAAQHGRDRRRRDADPQPL
jgi:hypothetical protein